MSVERELKWDDTIENDGGDFVLVPPGEYSFTIVGFTRGRHGGSAKLFACNKAELSVYIDDGEGNTTTVTNNQFLHTKTEGLLCQFFRSIGARAHGERMVMDWSTVQGATGRCKVGVRNWTGKDGATKQSNEIEKFLDPPNPPTSDQVFGPSTSTGQPSASAGPNPNAPIPF